MKKNCLEIINLCFFYEKNKAILNNINVKISENHSVGLVGANGSGKTTLFFLISGILKANSGKILVKGNPVKHGKFNQNVGFVFQNPDDQLFSPTVFEDISFGLYNLNYNEGEIINNTNRILEEMELTEIQSRPSQHLSGGEKRLVSLASVIVMNPDILLLDEPNSDLDMKYRRLLIEYLKSLNKTKLISSHDLEFIRETCEYCLLLDHGKVMAFDKTDKVFSDEKLMKKCHQEIPHSLKNSY